MTKIGEEFSKFSIFDLKHTELNIQTLNFLWLSKVPMNKLLRPPVP